MYIKPCFSSVWKRSKENLKFKSTNSKFKSTDSQEVEILKNVNLIFTIPSGWVKKGNWVALFDSSKCETSVCKKNYLSEGNSNLHEKEDYCKNQLPTSVNVVSNHRSFVEDIYK